MTDKLKSTEKQVDRLKSTEQPKVVQKANIATMYKTSTIFSELEQDLLEFIISQINIYDEHKSFEEITFKVTDFFFVTGRKFRPYNEVRAALNHIRDTGIYIAGETYSSWISSVTCPAGTNIFSVCIEPIIKDFIGFINGNYVNYKSEYVYCLKSAYSKKFYPVLKAALMGKDTKDKEFTLKELKDLFSISDDKYKKYNHFKEKVILQAQKEINNQTDIIFDFKEEKNGHAVYKLILTIKKNTTLNTNNNDMDTHHPMFVMFEKYKFGDKFKKTLFGLNSTDVERMQNNLQAANDYIQDKHITDEKQMFAIYTDSVNNNWQPKIKTFPEPQKQTEPKKYTTKNEKEFENKNKMVPIDELELVETIPEKSDVQIEFEKDFKKIVLEKFNDVIRIVDNIQNIDVYLDTINFKVIIYSVSHMIEYLKANNFNKKFETSIINVEKLIPVFEAYRKDNNFNEVKYQVEFKIIKR